MVKHPNRSKKARQQREEDPLTVFGKDFARLSRRVERIADHLLRQLDAAKRNMPYEEASEVMVNFLAASLMEKNEQYFRWLLESYAAARIRQRDDAKANRHPPHPTMN
jgi:hypothetical protein